MEPASLSILSLHLTSIMDRAWGLQQAENDGMEPPLAPEDNWSFLTWRSSSSNVNAEESPQREKYSYPLPATQTLKSHQNLGWKHKALALWMLGVSKAGENRIALGPVTKISQRAPGQEWSHFRLPGLANTLLYLDSPKDLLFPALITPTLGFPEPRWSVR